MTNNQNNLARGIYRPPKVFNPPPELRKRKVPRIIKLIIFLIVFFGALFYWLFFTDYFQIKNIDVDEGLPISTSLDYLKGKNILLVSSAKIKTQILADFPEVNDLKIFRGLPDTL